MAGKRRSSWLTYGTSALGVLVLAALIASVFLIEWRGAPPDPPETIRPLKTVTVGGPTVTVRSYPARVRARKEVTLAFQVPGVIEELPVTRGMRVSESETLAQLDLRDFETRRDARRAEHELADQELAAAQRVFDQGAMSQREIERIRTQAELARAERRLAEKALEDATLRAPFDGLVADIFVDQHENVSAGRRILRLQDVSVVRVEVNVHEERIARAQRDDRQYRHTVRFDFLPQEEFEAELVEFTTEATEATQTFSAIFALPPPDNMNVLPGMTATVWEYRQVDPDASAGAVFVPVESVLTDEEGATYVWIVEQTDDAADVATVRRARVEAGEVLGATLMIREGLNHGERIAAAGVHQLRNGQRVRPITISGPGMTQ